jgi:CheY-like chemotaxis protein
VLIVAEAEALCRALRAALDGDAFAIVAAARTASAATRACLDQAPDVAVIDAGLGAGEGLRAVPEVMAYCPTPILVLTAAADGQAAFEAMNLGALDAMGYPGPSAPSAAFGEPPRCSFQSSRSQNTLDGCRPRHPSWRTPSRNTQAGSVEQSQRMRGQMGNAFTQPPGVVSVLLQSGNRSDSGGAQPGFCFLLGQVDHRSGRRPAASSPLGAEKTQCTN